MMTVLLKGLDVDCVLFFQSYAIKKGDYVKGMYPMLDGLNLQAVGTPHRGIGEYSLAYHWGSSCLSHYILQNSGESKSYIKEWFTYLNDYFLCEFVDEDVYLFVSDDCKNIANILRALATLQCEFLPTYYVE